MLTSVPTIGPISPPANPIAIYRPLPWQVDPWRDTSPVLLLTGSAGGGKSRLAAEKVHGFCLRYSGATGLVLRKSRTSMNNSTLLFMDRKIIGKDPRVRHLKGYHRFEYTNDSVLAYGGMFDEEQREQVRGIGQDGGVDIVWLEEAHQFEESDFNEITARNRAKAGGFRQIILSTNPDTPLHWIYRRLIQGKEARVFYSRAQQNTYNPEDYLLKLDSMTGVEGERLREGNWVQAAGLIYDTWRDQPGEADSNVTEEAVYVPGAGPVVWFLDDGYSAGSAPSTRGRDPATGTFVGDAHPRVILLAQIKPDGRVDIFDELYGCLRLSDEQIQEAKALGYPDPDFVAHGPGAAEIRGRLYAAQLYPRMCKATVDESIKEAREAMAPDKNSFRKVRCNPRCKNLRAEMLACAYDGDTGKPAKQHDHGPDALRYGAWVLRFER